MGIEGWSVDECIDHFTALCKTAFTPRGIPRIPKSKNLAALSPKYSKYKTKPLERILKSSFSVADQPLFGSHLAYSPPQLKVAVTSTTDTNHQAVLLTNYNRSCSRPTKCKCHHSAMFIINKKTTAEYEFDRGETPDTELKVWEA